MTALAGARPKPRRFDLARPTDRSTGVALLIAAVIALLIVSPGFGGTAPGDPNAVASDPRLARCGGAVADVEYGFTIPHARGYQRYLPAMGRFSELALDRPALVLVYRAGFPGVAATASPSGRGSAHDATLRNLCIYVGEAGSGEVNYYRGISIAGLRANPAGPAIVPAPQT